MITFLLSQAVAMESAGFMNALTSAASAAPVVRKRKRVTAAKVFVYVVGVTFTLWWSITKKHFVYLFIYLFIYFIIMIIICRLEQLQLQQQHLQCQIPRLVEDLMLLHNYAYFSVVLLLHSLMANVLLQKLSPLPPQSVFGLNLSILQKILGWLHT